MPFTIKTMDLVAASCSSAAVTIPTLIPTGDTEMDSLVNRNCGERSLRGKVVFKVAWLPPQGAAAKRAMVPVVIYFQMMDGKPTLLVDDVKSNTTVHRFPIAFLRAYGQLDGHFILEAGRRCKGGPDTYQYLVGKNEVASAVKKFVADCGFLKAQKKHNLTDTPVDTSTCTLEQSFEDHQEAEAMFPAVLHLKLIDTKPTLIVEVEDADSKKVIRTFPIQYLRGYGQCNGKLTLVAGRRCAGGPIVYRYNVGTSDIASAMQLFVQQCGVEEGIQGTPRGENL